MYFWAQIEQFEMKNKKNEKLKNSKSTDIMHCSTNHNGMQQQLQRLFETNN